jgi:arylsulfatase A-like enzyme
MMRRRIFLACLACVLTGSAVAAPGTAPAAETAAPPNILFVFADQWRADALGYAGDPNVKTPNLDRLAGQAIQFTHAVSGCPVCCPYRASLMTGRRPLSHGVFLNDVQLPDHEVTIAEVLAARGYKTAYVGKWHLDGHGRSSYIPPERRQGFEYFKALECTHDYNRSYYYQDDDPTKRTWEGYDALAQTEDAIRYLGQQAQGKQPFLLMLSWGPPHNPYQTAPERFRAMYRADAIRLRPNVPPAQAEVAKRELAGYYAHCTALDECLGKLWQALEELGVERDTIFVFTSDHGDMLHCHGEVRKQRPWDESIGVPLLIRYPRLLGEAGKKLDARINTEDLMPTLLGLAGVPVPASVEGKDYSRYIQGGEDPSDGAALVTCPAPFGEWPRGRGGREIRGIRTARHTYVRTLDGPWLLYDNQTDPYQLDNLIGNPQHAELQTKLDALLRRRLEQTGDEFLPAAAYVEKWGYPVDQSGTVPYTR